MQARTTSFVRSLLASILLHELVHAVLKLGETSAFMAQALHYQYVRRHRGDIGEIPEVDFETARNDPESLLMRHARLHLSGRLIDHLLEVGAYGRKGLSRRPDDALAIAKIDWRRAQRVQLALLEGESILLKGRPLGGQWLDERLPVKKDRQLLENFLTDAAGVPAALSLRNIQSALLRSQVNLQSTEDRLRRTREKNRPL